MTTVTSQSVPVSSQMHPLMMGAAVSVIVVSMLGAAAMTGILPSSHGQAGSSPASETLLRTAAASAPLPVLTAYPASSTRYVTPDGQLLDLAPPAQRVTPVRPVRVTQVEEVAPPAPARIRKAVHRPAPQRLEPARRSYAQQYDNAPIRTNEPVYQPTYQPAYQPPVQQPARSYVGDMHPVGTGVGAVVGGLLGNQIGGGNGKKLATVAGVLLGGYAGNEVAHNRNPLPW